jgi:hypothetical protein
MQATLLYASNAYHYLIVSLYRSLTYCKGHRARKAAPKCLNVTCATPRDRGCTAFCIPAFTYLDVKPSDAESTRTALPVILNLQPLLKSGGEAYTMFSNSVRRAALAVKPTSAIVSSAPRAVSTQALSCRPLQRRYSSSKPSSPADGSKPVVDVAATPRTENGKSKKQRRKAKDAAPKSDLTSNLPSVPSTGHLQGKGTSLAKSEFGRI